MISAGEGLTHLIGWWVSQCRRFNWVRPNANGSRPLKSQVGGKVEEGHEGVQSNQSQAEGLAYQSKQAAGQTNEWNCQLRLLWPI